jgi:hypothetical protein
VAAEAMVVCVLYGLITPLRPELNLNTDVRYQGL